MYRSRFKTYVHSKASPTLMRLRLKNTGVVFEALPFSVHTNQTFPTTKHGAFENSLQSEYFRRFGVAVVDESECALRKCLKHDDQCNAGLRKLLIRLHPYFSCGQRKQFKNEVQTVHLLLVLDTVTLF